jgi:hypothetical protein
MSTRLSVSACISSAPIGCIFVKFDIGDIYENLSSKSKFVKSEKDIGHFTWRPKCLSCFDSDICSATTQRTPCCASMATFSVFQLLCWLPRTFVDNTKGTHCCVSVEKMVTRTCHSVTLYAHCLHYFTKSCATVTIFGCTDLQQIPFLLRP